MIREKRPAMERSSVLYIESAPLTGESVSEYDHIKTIFESFVFEIGKLRKCCTVSRRNSYTDIEPKWWKTKEIWILISFIVFFVIIFIIVSRVLVSPIAEP